jgi:hypothetical protein
MRGGDRIDQPRDVTLDQLVLQGQGRGRDHDATVVEQRRDQVGQRLAGAGSGLDDQVSSRAHGIAHRLCHGDLTRPLLTAQRTHRRTEDVGDG